MDDLNLIGKMHWGACDDCEIREMCGDKKTKAFYNITSNEVICKNHQEILAEIGTVNMIDVCTRCKIYDNYFKMCGLDTMCECEPVEYLITSSDVRCLSYKAIVCIGASSSHLHSADTTESASVSKNTRMNAGA